MDKLKSIEKTSLYFEITVCCFRTLLFIYIIVDLWSEKGTVPHFYLHFIWIMAALIVPHFFWLPGRVNKRMHFCFAELLLSGSLAIYLQTINSESYLFALPALIISSLVERRFYWMIIFLVLFPFAGSVTKGMNMETVLGSLFDSLFFPCIGFGFNILTKAYKKTQELNKVIEEQNHTLVQHAKQIEKLTLVEERNRMSRELHDTLGHSFISYIIGLDAVMYLVDSNPELAKKKLEELRMLTTKNLEEIRSTIHEIGDQTDIQLADSFAAIIHEFGHHTNTKVTFNISGEEYFLTHQVRITLLRCLQESLTNAKRHGNAAEVLVCLVFLEGEVQLKIQDGGIGTENIQYGFGLKTMKERIESLNGTFLFSSTVGKGTTIQCCIPYRG
ncbi:sensor histidine kinase [Bacillus songklensis]|uniref:histidine kinase n=1 Tax=Bacillus songklensis TaxID=1069116 RepID=A0ABV8B563_9BACI